MSAFFPKSRIDGTDDPGPSSLSLSKIRVKFFAGHIVRQTNRILAIAALSLIRLRQFQCAAEKEFSIAVAGGVSLLPPIGVVFPILPNIGCNGAVRVSANFEFHIYFR